MTKTIPTSITIDKPAYLILNKFTAKYMASKSEVIRQALTCLDNHQQEFKNNKKDPFI